jgi:hypothetical protein
VLQHCNSGIVAHLKVVLEVQEYVAEEILIPCRNALFCTFFDICHGNAVLVVNQGSYFAVANPERVPLSFGDVLLIDDQINMPFLSRRISIKFADEPHNSSIHR